MSDGNLHPVMQSALAPFMAAAHPSVTFQEWRVEGRADGGILISEGVNSYRDGPERYVFVLKADRTAALQDADVNKVVAAPAMLAALKALNESILGRAESNASGNPEWEYVRDRVNAARAAIALAEGK